MNKLSLLVIASLFALGGCSLNNKSSSSSEVSPLKYGVFLGANETDKEKIAGFNNAVIDVDEFSSESISYIRNKGTTIYGYLSVGTLENYRSWYDQFKDYTFMDYENWPDERWMDISQTLWQNHLFYEASRFFNMGVKGIFMDNFDVYYIAKEVYKGSDINAEQIYAACLNILDGFNQIGLKLIINSGTDLLERMKDENNSLIDVIDCYCQECVFSSIEDYEKDIFGRQSEEEKQYYESIISIMEPKSDILLLEYTKDREVIRDIVSYCNEHNYYYYISSSLTLK